MMMKRMISLFYRLLILVLSAFVFLPPYSIRATAGQLSDIFIITQTELEALLTTARANIASYPTVFKDLAAEETKIVEIYEKPGALSGKRRIVSDFIVYQSQRDPAVMTEYRNVREVDGVSVSGRDERAIKLFERLAKADSIAPDPLVVSRFEFQYAPSSFEVWVPERMVFSVFSPVKLITGKVPDMYLRGRTINEYTSFKRFDVKAQEEVVSPRKQPQSN